MLEFFRKYQRYFFVAIAVVIIVSFSFFGTHHALFAPVKAKDFSIGTAVDGSKLMRSETDQMIRFLWSDRDDSTLVEKGIMPNLFNDGVIKKDLLGSGIGEHLTRAYFDELKDELTECMQRHKSFRPYRHPSAPFISVENLWTQALPTQKMNLDRFLEETQEMTMETFNLLVDLCLGETLFPPGILREYLMLQQRHHKWVEPDPELNRVNLNLFRCRTVEDWFGPRFLELSAQFIANAALLAQQRGYKVSYEEARVGLMRNGHESLKSQRRRENAFEGGLSSLWQKQLLQLNMSEASAVRVWQKVMLFRSLFEDVGGAVFVDPHIYRLFHKFASKTAEVELYHLPSTLEMKDFNSMMKLELYLKAISGSETESLMLPKTFASALEVEKTYPELIQERFLVEVAKVEREEIALNVNMKEMWEWQLEKENYALLTTQFPILSLKKAENTEGYFAALEELDPATRQRVDRFSRKQIVNLHPEWIQSALDESYINKREVDFSSSAKYPPLEGLISNEPLKTLFSRAVLNKNSMNDPETLDARKQLEVFTSDGETYYRFRVLDHDVNKIILTFAQANERGILDALLDAHLEAAYTKLRHDHPPLFKTEKNEWKPFAEVREEVGRLVYSHLLKAIEDDVQEAGCTLSSDRYENLNGFYPTYRLYSFMRSAFRDIQHLGDSSSFLSQPTPPEGEEEGVLDVVPPLEMQWSLIKESKIFKNNEKSHWPTPEIFSMVEGSWSDVAPHGRERLLSFFQLKNRSIPDSDFCSEIRQGQVLLSKEAKTLLMQEVIKMFKEGKVIHLHELSS